MDPDETLRIAGCLSPPLLSRDSGPGLRWLLFLQGCRRPCTDQCLNPAYLDPRGGRAVTLTELRAVAGQVAAGTYGPAEGLTLLGGEPTDQARAVRPLVEEARAVGLSVMLYSGHPLRWFHRPGNEDARRLLDFVDILVDGPFIPTLARPELRWRGSTNQGIRVLTDRYDPDRFKDEQEHVGVTVTLRGSGVVTLSGLQNRRAAAAVEERLQSRSRTAPGQQCREPRT